MGNGCGKGANCSAGEVHVGPRRPWEYLMGKPGRPRSGPRYPVGCGKEEKKACLSFPLSLTGAERVHVPIPEPITVARVMGCPSWLSPRSHAPTETSYLYCLLLECLQ